MEHILHKPVIAWYHLYYEVHIDECYLLLRYG